jgi:hypothetical protein
VAGHGGFDLARGVEGDRKPAACGGGKDDAAHLGHAHHRADVVLAEDSFDGDGIRLGGVQHGVDRCFYRQQSLFEGGIRRRPGHGYFNEGEPAPWSAVDHPDSATSQTRVDAEYSHRPTSHLFFHPMIPTQ